MQRIDNWQFFSKPLEVNQKQEKFAAEVSPEDTKFLRETLIERKTPGRAEVSLWDHIQVNFLFRNCDAFKNWSHRLLRNCSSMSQCSPRFESPILSIFFFCHPTTSLLTLQFFVYYLTFGARQPIGLKN